MKTDTYTKVVLTGIAIFLGVIAFDYKPSMKAEAGIMGGGEMIDSVTKDGVIYNSPPNKFEAGTPGIVSVIGLGAAIDYINEITTDFVELHGDRIHKDDRAIIGGFAKIDGQKVMIIGSQKGRDTKTNVECNFGCAHPEGYRKALRLMKLADKFNIPIVTFIDTKGAYAGLASEERHIAEAIAVNLRECFNISVPIISIVVGAFLVVLM